MVRYISSAHPWKVLDSVLRTGLDNTHHVVQYNIQPGDLMTVIKRSADSWVMDQSLWAWSSYAGSIDHNIINARMEGMFSQNAFRFAIRNNRCVIPVDGFYSVLKKPGKEVVANRITNVEDKPLFAAAVVSQEGRCVNPITAGASHELSDIADRQLILFNNKADVQTWCDKETKVTQLDALLKRSLGLSLSYYAITKDIEKDVNSPVLHERRHRHLTLFD